MDCYKERRQERRRRQRRQRPRALERRQECRQERRERLERRQELSGTGGCIAVSHKRKSLNRTLENSLRFWP